MREVPFGRDGDFVRDQMIQRMLASANDIAIWPSALIACL